jgi:hypothetical protein
MTVGRKKKVWIGLPKISMQEKKRYNTDVQE